MSKIVSGPFNRITGVIVNDKRLLPYLAFWTRLLLKNRKPKIIGITGTAGKTTVTQMLGHVLMHKAAKPYIGTALRTSGNRNGDYGIRASILNTSIDYYTSNDKLKLFLAAPFKAIGQSFFKSYPNVLVLEYGTFSKGHIHDLVKLAPPYISIVTNIGPAHLERHKTVEGVYYEKRALVQGANPDGLVVLGSGHDFVDRLKQDAKAPVVVLEGRGTELAKEICIVVCNHFGMPKGAVEEALKDYKVPAGRLNRFKSGNFDIIDDAYNANPLSMQLGLDTLAKENPVNGRRVALLGVMAELGELSEKYHEEIGIFAKGKADFIIGVGEGTQKYNPDVWFADSAQCAGNLHTVLRDNDTVLVKGSNAAKMGVVIDELKKNIVKV